MEFKCVLQQGPELEEVRALFLEYAQGLGFSLCFQGFDAELAGLPGAYAPPQGALLLASGKGCVAVRAHDPVTAEMKRLFVRTAWRGTGLGRRLAQAVIEEAHQRGYQRIVLDTIAGKMDEAIGLYRALGFREIASYTVNPVPGAFYMELSLR